MTPAVTRSLARVASVAAVGVLAGALALLAAPVGASAGTTERVSVDSAGNQGNRGGGAPSLSADGRFVAFFSGATDLVPDGSTGVFINDRQTATTEWVVAGNMPALSADGRFVAFVSRATNLVPGDTNGSWDVFVRDRQTGITERVSVDSAGNQGDGGSGSVGTSADRLAISADGRFVAFASDATNLAPGTPTRRPTCSSTTDRPAPPSG